MNHRIGEPTKAIRYQRLSGTPESRQRAAELATKLGQKPPFWAEPDHWWISCQCGWTAQHDSKQDAIDNGDEHIRIMGHVDDE